MFFIKRFKYVQYRKMHQSVKNVSFFLHIHILSSLSYVNLYTIAKNILDVNAFQDISIVCFFNVFIYILSSVCKDLLQKFRSFSADSQCLKIHLLHEPVLPHTETAAQMPQH